MTDINTSKTLKPTGTLAAALIMSTLLIALSGCQEEGPMEKAGETIDEATESVGETLEEAGEAIEDAVEGE
jgi:hypothetical protein